MSTPVGAERGASISPSGRVPGLTGLLKFVDDALERNATAIHVEPLQDSVQVRLRIEGRLQVWGTMTREAYDLLIEELKRSQGQAGPDKNPPYFFDLRLRIENRKLRLFITSVPTFWGEKIAFEVLGEGPPIELNLGRLGFEKDGLKQFREAIRRRHGLVIVAGPIESGKKTTIYAALMELNKANINIATVEWYFRRRLKGIQQTKINDEAGLDPSAAMTTLLESDVDVIYVQEMLHSDVFDIVLKAAFGDKLVFTEWRADDAPHVLVQLSYRNVEPWRICEAVLLINAQRLLRKLCPECREKIEINPKALLDVGLSQDQIATAHIFRPVGCEMCADTGYRGKVLVCETMPLTDDLKAAYSAGAPSGELKKIAVRGGMSTLRMSGLRKMVAGLTTLDEVLMNTPSDAS